MRKHVTSCLSVLANAEIPRILVLPLLSQAFPPAGINRPLDIQCRKNVHSSSDIDLQLRWSIPGASLWALQVLLPRFLVAMCTASVPDITEHTQTESSIRSKHRQADSNIHYVTTRHHIAHARR
eukprot:576136-Rhodomonas_salina.1